MLLILKNTLWGKRIAKFIVIMILPMMFLVLFQNKSYAEEWQMVPLSNVTDKEISDFLKIINSKIDNKEVKLKVKLIDLYRNDNGDGSFTYIAHYSDPNKTVFSLTVRDNVVEAVSTYIIFGNTEYNNDITGYYGLVLMSLSGMSKVGVEKLWKAPIESALNNGETKVLEEQGDVRIVTEASILSNKTGMFITVFKQMRI